MGQITTLARDFPNGVLISKSSHHLKWEMDVVPTPNSRTYRIRMEYSIGAPPRVRVIVPSVLPKAPGKDFLPHVFSTEKQQICLYYGKFWEWNPSMLLSRKIVPWAAEWLFYYELWVLTGEWLGGGIEHGSRREDT